MQIREEAGADRFVADVEEGRAYLEYVPKPDGVRNLLHTFVSPDQRGQGVGEALVQFALDHARENGYRIIPSCPFVRAWIAEHPDYQDVVAQAK